MQLTSAGVREYGEDDMRLRLKTRILFNLRWWFNIIALYEPYMWRCDKKDCYFMVSTNNYEVFTMVRDQHLQQGSKHVVKED